MAMNLKPFRRVSEHDIINEYSTVEGNLTKGTVVEYVSADPDNQNGYGDPLPNVPGYAWSADYVVNWKVKAATSGSNKIAGILLKDVVTNFSDPWSMDARFAPDYKLAEKQVVVSGRAVPFATEGRFEFVGFQGTPGAGSGVGISNSGNGILTVTAPGTAGNIGRWQTSSGVNGSAIAFIRVPVL